MPSQFGYWTIRGWGQAPRLMLELVGEDYIDDRVDLINGEEKYFEEKKKNPHELSFPNLPYYKDGDIRLTQSMAILRYLARKYNMGSSTEEEARQLDMLEGVVQDTRLYFFDICHGTAENFKLNLPMVTERSIMFYKLLDGYLGPRRWFLGERITYVDIMAYDSMSNWLAMKPNMLDGCDNLKGLMKRFEALPNMKKYMESGRYISWPINGKDAHFSFK